MNEQNLPKITLVSASVFVKWLTEGINEIYAEYGKLFEFQLYFLNDIDSGKVSKQEFMENIYESEIFLMDIRGNCPTVELIVETFNKMESNQPELFAKKTIISLVGGNSELRRLTKMGPFEARKIPSPKSEGYDIDEIPDLTDAVRFGQRMTSFMKVLGRFFPIKTLRHARNWGLMMDYWVYGLGGLAENHKNMILFLLIKYLGHKELDAPKPIKIPSYGIYDLRENQYFEKLDKYIQKNPLESKKQTIGIFFYGGLYFEQSLPIVEVFIENLTDFNVIPVFSDVLTNLEAFRELFFTNDRCIVSGIINLQYFQLNGGPFGGDGSATLNLFREMDIPHFNPIIQYDMPCDKYRESQEGIIPINQIIAVVMPELDGRFEMLTVGCMKNLGYSDEIQADVMDVFPLRDNISFVASRFRKWLNLRNKLNYEKKVALVVYNYPPGEGKIGNAAYLDVSESVRNLIAELQKERFNAKNFPKDKSVADLFIEGGSVNNPKHTAIEDFNGILVPKEKYLELIEDIPRELRQEIEHYWGSPIGNIMTFNSSIKLPIIQLGNVYLCLQPSRSTVSGDPNEYHDKNIPPHHQYIAFYRFLERILNVDAFINIGTHGTEEFLPGKECAGSFRDFPINLLGDVPNIYYYHITNTSESAIAKRRANSLIINHAGPSFKNSDLYQELEALELLIREYMAISEGRFENLESSKKSERVFDLEKEIEEMANQLEISYSNISELEDTLYRYKTSVIPMGLHTLGKMYTEDEKVNIVSTILLNSAEIPEKIENIVNNFGFKEEEKRENLELFLKLLLDQVKKNQGTDDNVIKILIEKIQNDFLSEEDSVPLIEWIAKLVERMDKSMEMENIIHALEGGYIEPGLGGDPVRSPHIFPTGRNSYGFDPRLIPNSTAYKRGREIAESIVNQYKETNGTYPETTSVVLWAFETMKTGGETIGQIFNYLGVRAVKNKSIWTTEFEIMPLEEMNHPRINVLVTICGIFRDTFPYLLELINQAIEAVGALEEPIEKNFVRKALIELEKEGIENAKARVFGPPPGKYNTNLTQIISAGKWKEENELVEDYIDNMSFAYMSNQKVMKSPETFSQNVKRIKVMSQVRDSAEYHITDLDHYYEFTGGLARTHEQLTGQKAGVVIADTSRKKISVESIDKVIKEGAITRTLNPRWIKSMLNHKYHGGQKVAERVENVLGLSATTHEVDKWIWEKSYNQYVENEEIREALIDNNRFAMMDIVKNMLQADNRGYWEATDDQIDNLKKLYLELENWVESIY